MYWPSDWRERCETVLRFTFTKILQLREVDTLPLHDLIHELIKGGFSYGILTFLLRSPFRVVGPSYVYFMCPFLVSKSTQLHTYTRPTYKAQGDIQGDIQPLSVCWLI